MDDRLLDHEWASRLRDPSVEKGEKPQIHRAFSDYVAAHTVEQSFETHGVGSVGGGDYSLYEPASLIPIDGVKFSVYTVVEREEDISEENTGYSLSLMYGDRERYRIDLSKGGFTENDDDQGMGNPVEPDRIAKFLDNLKRIEAEGRMRPKQ